MSAPTRCPAIQPGTNAACCIAVHGPDTPHAWDDGDAWPGYLSAESRRYSVPCSECGLPALTDPAMTFRIRDGRAIGGPICATCADTLTGASPDAR